MLPQRRIRLAASGGVFMALLGVWLGHTAEYARVSGMAGIREELAGSIHWYMAPIGLLLALVAATGAVRVWRIWSALGRQLDAARLALFAAWRGHRRPAPNPLPRTATPSRGATLGVLWLALTATQLCLYLLQENLEALAARVPAPGLGAVTGLHWAAPLVHAGVALVLSAVAILLVRAVQRRRRVIGITASLLRVLLATLSRASSTPAPAVAPRPRPADRFGRLWCRPPPLLLATG